MKTESILLRTRVPERRYRKAEEILNRLGMNPGDAVNMLMAQIELRQGLPFELLLAPKQLITPEQQLEAWTEALGEY